ncbi:MAG: 2-oxo-4-hydroxy-4-carboxy-5-ureidoimidazoline decarboxylase [Planctomycetes bacterium]|nr:2-oxo-4-hydroxy-4-carboxy-5-ureidoimidazoline decarboxylase [Planctomycetota bacterium]
MTIAQFDAMSRDEAAAVMKRCCGTETWCAAMARSRPFHDLAAAHVAADRCFDALTESDWLRAFAAHPKIGDVNSLRMKFVGNREWSHGEQSGVSSAGDAVIEQLAAGNGEYEKRFGFIFIICATGKSAAQMLALLRERLPHDRAAEVKIAAGEQRKITHLRLDKMFA